MDNTQWYHYPGLTQNHSIYTVAQTIAMAWRSMVKYSFKGNKEHLDNSHRFARRHYDNNFRTVWRPKDEPVQRYRQTWQRNNPGLRYDGQSILVEPIFTYAALVYRAPDRIHEPYYRDSAGTLYSNKGFFCDSRQADGTRYHWRNNILNEIDTRQRDIQRQKLWDEVYAPKYSEMDIQFVEEVPF